MATIGSIVIALEAQSEQFERTLKNAEKALDSLNHKAEEGGGLKGMFAEGLGVGTAIEGIHMVGEAIEKVVDLGKEAVEAVAETVQEVTKTFRLAGTLNMPTDTLMAYQSAAKAAGVDTEALAGAIEHMTRSIANGAEDGGRAAAAIDKLGLSSKDLASQGADKAFEAIADKIAAIENPFQRATAAADIFGSKMSGKLMPLLMQGAAGLEHFKDEGKEFGNTLNDFEAAKLVAVNEEFNRMSERMEGIKDRIVVAVAPALLAMGKEIEDLIPPADKMKEYIVTGLHDVAMAIGYVCDGWRLVQIGVGEMRELTAITIAGLVGLIDELAHAVEGLINHLPGVKVHFTETLDAIRDNVLAVAKDIGQSTADEINKPWPHEAVDAAFKHINQEADKTAGEIASKHSNIAAPIDEAFEASAEKVAKTLEELKKQVDEFGMTEGQKKLFEMKADHDGDEAIAQAQKYVDALAGMKNAKDATEEINKLKTAVAEFNMTAGEKKMHEFETSIADPQLRAEAKAQEKQLEALEQQKTLAEEGKRIHEEMLSPLEKYNAELDHLQSLLSANAISQDDYARSAAKAAEELDKQNKEKDKHEKHANEKANAEVRRFDFRVLVPRDHDGGGKATSAAASRVNIEKQMVTTAQSQLKASERQTFLQEEMYRFQRDHHDGTGGQNDVQSVI